MDQGFKIAFVTGNSDLSGHDIETISEADPSGQAPTDICQLALQIRVKRKLPMAFMAKGVLDMFNKWRVAELGNRILHFKVNGGMLPDGTLRFYEGAGCYTLNFSQQDDYLDTVTHIGGDTADVESKWGLTRDNCELVENQDDFLVGIKLGLELP